MKKELVETADGSKTLYITDLNEYYHFVHGALFEAQHVYIKHGLKLTPKKAFYFRNGLWDGA